MKLAGDYVFEAEPQEVWDALFDPEILAAAMPGCEKLERVDGHFVGELNVKVGPISGKFSGKVQLVDQVPPQSYRMIIDGKGPHGFVKATATITLATEGTATRMTYDADAQVGGKIATVGQRLIETSAKAITKQSLEGLHENIKIRAAAYRAAAAAQAAQTSVAGADEVVEGEEAATPASEPAAEAAAAADEGAPAAAPPAAAEKLDEATTSAAKPGDAKPGDAKPSAAEPGDAKPAAAVTPATPRSAAPAKLDVHPTYKKADAAKLAGTVTREVMRTMLPWILVVLLTIALVISLVTR